MTLQQPNANAVWSEPKNTASNQITKMGLVDQGTHFSVEETTDPDARFLDDGNGAFETSLDVDNPSDLPELELIDIGGAAIITVE